MTTLSAFTNQIYNLSVNLSKMFPEDPDLAFTKNAVYMLKKNNPRKLQIAFNDYIYQYNQQVMKKDEKFLIETDFLEDETVKQHASNVEYAEKIMDNLRKYWNQMDDESKENIWKYLQVLMILNEKCVKN